MSVPESPRLHEVDVQAIDAARLEPLIGAQRMAQVRAGGGGRAGDARRQLAC